MRALTPRRPATAMLCGALALALLAIVAPGAPAGAQARPPGDTLGLAQLQADALRTDPRAEQLELLGAQTDLRLETLEAERLPSLEIHGQGQYQSDVPSVPIELPGGMTPPIPHKDTYDAYASIRQSLYDPSIGPRRQVEAARLAESRARVDAALYDLRRRVNEAFFSTLLLAAQASEVDAAIVSLQAQLEVAERRVADGAALPSEAATLRREILRRGQLREELRAAEAASRQVLAELVGRPLAEGTVLVPPDLAAIVAETRSSLNGFEDRPEMERFARSRELLDVQMGVIGARDQPRISAFGRGGYGRPGLNPLSTAFDNYWLGGVQLDWSPWSWGATTNERQELRLQQVILASEQAAFAEELRRGVITELATIDRLAGALQGDEEIISLSEEILAETRLRFDEAVVTSAELVDRETDLLEARLALIAHRLELAHARARFLTLIGHELP